MKTYGTLKLSKGKWKLEAEPHVIIRAKRLFPQLTRKTGDNLTLADTIDTSRDLAWFLERYPLEMTKEDAARLHESASVHRERETLVAKLLAGQAAPRAFELAIPPRDYQKVAAELVLTNRGLLLCDDLGLGKTASAICMISDPRARPALVVTLTHLTRQWQAELRKFAPQLSTHILKKGTPYDLTLSPRARRGQLAMPGTSPDVIITNYHKLGGWSETLAGVVRSVTFDEGQELRSGDGTKKGAAARTIADACEYRLSLTATPIYNLGGEIWNVLRPVAPNALGTLEEFRTEWCGEVDAHGRAKLQNPKAFGTYLRETAVMLRRTREEVGRELPEVVRVPHEVDVDEHHLKDIESAATDLARVILESGQSFRGEKMQAAQELSALVRHATGVAKAPYVADFVRILLESGEPVVLFGWHRDVYSVWQERLAEYAPSMYTGSESEPQKNAAKERFLSGETSLMIISLRAGAGLDGLQERCRTIVFGELDWSTGVMDQCVGRLHRDGQKNSVVAYYLLSPEGSDPIVADLLQVKRSQLEGLRNPTQDLIEKLDVSGDQIRELAAAYLKKGRERASPARPKPAPPPPQRPELVQKSLL
jgi:SNF2 family DNA or RNA helicase